MGSPGAPGADSLPLLVRLGEKEWTVWARSKDTVSSLVDILRRVHGIDLPKGDASLLLSRNGRCIPARVPLWRARLGAWDSLELRPRLLGGGGDGGSTGAESRSSYLEMYAKKKPSAGDPAATRLARWTTCALSGEPLRAPIVIDEVGSLYNKTALIDALLEKRLPKTLAHISGLRSVVELRALHAGVSGDALRAPLAETLACPLTGAPFNGTARMVVHNGTGFVFAERALRDAQDAVAEAIGRPDGACSLPEWIPINPGEEEARELRIAALSKLSAAKLAKREKKKLKGEAGDEGVAGRSGKGDTAALGAPKNGGVKKAKAASKAHSVADLAPANADPAVWKSLFKNGKDDGDSYMCRGANARGLVL